MDADATVGVMNSFDEWFLDRRKDHYLGDLHGWDLKPTAPTLALCRNVTDPDINYCWNALDRDDPTKLDGRRGAANFFVQSKGRSGLTPCEARAWTSEYPDKPLPVVAWPDNQRPTGFFLLQAESRFKICVYWFQEGDMEINLAGTYIQPIARLMQSMRVRVRWIVALLAWHTETVQKAVEKAHRPGGPGFQCAKDDFEGRALAQKRSREEEP